MPISCPMQSTATRLTSFAMMCRWFDPVSLSTTPERCSMRTGLTKTPPWYAVVVLLLFAV